MKHFIKHKITRKLKIMMFIFLIVNLVLLWLLIEDFLKYSISIYYIFFILIGILMSSVFRKDRTIKWDNNLQKVIKNTEITTIILIVSIVLIRKFLLPSVFEELHLGHITVITLLITFWFFSGKLYFMWDKLKDIFCEVYEK